MARAPFTGSQVSRLQEGLQPGTSTLTGTIIGAAIALVILTLAAIPVAGSIIAFRETQPLVQLPWFLPVAQAFVIISALAISFLLMGRYLSLGGSWAFWSGAVFLANAVLSTFYLLSWPGLLGDHGLIGQRSNTASWLFCLTFSCLALLVAALRTAPEGKIRPVKAGYLSFGVVAVTAILVGVLSVTFENALPQLVVGLDFTTLNIGWVLALSVLLAAGAFFAYRRYSEDKDTIFGYLSLFLLLTAFGLLYSIMGGKRYDPWWYASRALYDLAYIAMLFGLLQEGYSLFGRERVRAEERKQLLEEIRRANSSLVATSTRAKERAEAEEEARSLAEEAVRARDEFISVAAHELKTPVTSLQGFSQLLIRQYNKTGALEPERTVKALERIEEQSKRLTRLTEQLLNLSRLQSGKLAITRTEVDTLALVANILNDIRHSHPGRAIELKSKSSIPACLDGLRMEQVITNLVDNALKFSPNDRHVEVELGVDEQDRLTIAVRDYGIGIPEEKRGNLFARFYQVHPERHYGGMGIGLFVSRQIVELHGGTIDLEQPDGEGSRFVVRVPRGPCDDTHSSTSD